jgi:hypothetical protein
MGESTDRTVRFDPPRPMTERETEILALMLAGDDPALQPLRAQASVARVRSMCGCGCATIDFDFDSDAQGALPASPVARFQVHASSRESLAAAGADPWGVILFVDGGRLASLELVWYERPIGTFPPATDLEALADPY